LFRAKHRTKIPLELILITMAKNVLLARDESSAFFTTLLFMSSIVKMVVCIMGRISGTTFSGRALCSSVRESRGIDTCISPLRELTELTNQMPGLVPFGSFSPSLLPLGSHDEK